MLWDGGQWGLKKDSGDCERHAVFTPSGRPQCESPTVAIPFSAQMWSKTRAHLGNTPSRHWDRKVCFDVTLRNATTDVVLHQFSSSVERWTAKKWHLFESWWALLWETLCIWWTQITFLSYCRNATIVTKRKHDILSSFRRYTFISSQESCPPEGLWDYTYMANTGAAADDRFQ